MEPQQESATPTDGKNLLLWHPSWLAMSSCPLTSWGLRSRSFPGVLPSKANSRETASDLLVYTKSNMDRV
jgi:hypothetical protein